jgi:glycosyltransferase involved in cell wall biosynthesis
LQGFHKNPYPFIKYSDAFVSVSIVESYPLVIAEALCLGKAIMATKVTGSKEM